MKWYVLMTKPGEELEAAAKLDHAGYKVLLPSAIRLIRSGGAYRTEENVLIPGYVTVLTDYDADNYYRIKDIPEIIRFVGNGEKSYLSYLEAEWMRLLSEHSPIGPSKARKTDDGYEIFEGLLKSFPKDDVKILAREKKATLTIRICGEEKQLTLSIEVEGNDSEATET